MRLNYFKKKYYQFARRLYGVGKLEFERQTSQMMFERGRIAAGTVFHAGAEINNLSGNPDKILIGQHCQIAGMLLVYAYGGFIKMGDYCSLSPGARIVSTNKIEIGNRVLIAHNVNIIDNISHPLDAALRHEDFIKSYTIGMQEYDLKSREIIIEDDVWIGFNATIMKGVKIGRGAIIGSNSVVTKDIPAWTVNAGNPLRCIRELSPVEINNLT